MIVCAKRTPIASSVSAFDMVIGVFATLTRLLFESNSNVRLIAAPPVGRYWTPTVVPSAIVLEKPTIDSRDDPRLTLPELGKPSSTELEPTL